MGKIKMIVVDMDGTFLDTNHDYNRERFESLYQKLKEQQIKFVVASGNQYFQLKSFFKGKDHELSYISDNGGLIIKENEELFCGDFGTSLVDEVVSILDQYENLDYILSGRKTAYIKKSAPFEFKEMVRIYNHRLKEVEKFENIDDKILKFALLLPKEDTVNVLERLKIEFKDRVTPVSSGHGSIDIIIPGLHKGSALSLLKKEWNIARDEVMVFGDGGNDIEMLEHVYHSYAMDNAPDYVKAVSRFLAPSNINEGVLEIIEQYLHTGNLE